MAKATYTTAAGTKILLEGSVDEIAELIAKLESPAGERPAKEVAPSSDAKKKGATKSTIATLIADLVDRAFFNPPKELGQVRAELEASGHFYPSTTLSPALLRMVKSRQLRRVKQDNKWLYTR
jgi:hypothetical protein